MNSAEFPVVGLGASAGGAGPNQGSEFSIYLPRTVIVDESAIPAPRQDGGAVDAGAPLRILVADDNRDNPATLKMLLELSGHDVLLAHSDSEALDTATRARPDVGIFDIAMPDLNGYALAERIRHEAWGKHITLIALTGWGQELDNWPALSAGFDHHLTKPVDPEFLERLLQE